MTRFTSILAATDFSVDGNNAVRRAALLAHQHGARLHILHVLRPEGCKPLREWFSPTLDIDLKAAQARAALRRVAERVARGADPQEIFAVVATEASQLLGEQAMTPDSLAVAACNSPAPLGLRIPSGIGTATG